MTDRIVDVTKKQYLRGANIATAAAVASFGHAIFNYAASSSAHHCPGLSLALNLIMGGFCSGMAVYGYASAANCMPETPPQPQ